MTVCTLVLFTSGLSEVQVIVYFLPVIPRSCVIRNINMCRYINSAHGHELSGCVVFTHTLKRVIIMPGLNTLWLKSKLLLTIS